MRDTFPDAQLVLDLRGATPTPLTPAQALQRIISALAPEAKPPDDLAELQPLYRSLLHGKRILILADDARDTAQVRPLLPPAGSALLITTHRQFRLDGMVTIDLTKLTDPEAVTLLQTICPRLDEGQARQIARLCDNLPLALRISAGILANDDTIDVATYLARLTDERQRLMQLRDPDDPDLDVEASLALSYELLDSTAQEVLAQLGVFVASFDQVAAETIMTLPEGMELESALSLLRRRNLLEYDAALARYDMHELVRVFARTRQEDADELRQRYAEHYARVAIYTGQLFRKGGECTNQGLALFDQERAHIDAGWHWARESTQTPERDVLLVTYADATVHIGDLRYAKQMAQIPQLEAALAAAQRQEDRRAQERFLGNLGNVYVALGNVRQAIALYEQVLSIAREIGDRRAPDMAQVLQSFAPLLEAITAIARGDDRQWAEVEISLAELETQGWHLVKPVRRIWAGERDAERLTATLDPNSALLIRRVLELISAPPTDAANDTTHRPSIGSGGANVTSFWRRACLQSSIPGAQRLIQALLCFTPTMPPTMTRRLAATGSAAT